MIDTPARGADRAPIDPALPRFARQPPPIG
jgi:hypothetical protein